MDDSELDLSGLEKASVLIMSLGAVASAQVFERLTPDERDLLGAEIVRLRQIDSVRRQSVLEEANRMIGPAPESGEAGGQVVGPAEPLKWLEGLDPDQAVRLLAGERAPNVALIVAHLSAEAAAGILSRMDEPLRNESALRLTRMKPVPREAVEAVDEVLRKRMSEMSGEPSVGTSGPGKLMRMIGEAGEVVRARLGGGLSARGDREERAFLSPEDMLELPDDEIRSALIEMDTDDISLALRVASEELRAAVMSNCRKTIRARLAEELGMAAQVKLREIEFAQQRIVSVLSRLAREGKMGHGEPKAFEEAS